ncbi:hypothetical protein AYJ54_02885 [Bradyrhizobium centrolobii]|uniref:Uncharacterized protein n=1 Tax=Bradyrhizobium centrolobii TaxID=1505087 RepID=A0A176YGS8_9BRAD|nr:hypothetical protein [Bradyrhizobium centrolobii]OAF05843.1 hypothetical protein AYJ54_02885 [Bradyrhizobium centrolobii]
MVSGRFDIAYRIVAIALCVYSGRELWYGLVERKITFISSDLLDWSRWSTQVFHRDTEPVRYWIQINGTTFGMVACFVAAIIGWWQPNT